MVLVKFGFDFSGILGSAQAAISDSASEAVAHRDVLAPGAQYGGSETSKINLLSLGMALVLGTAGLLHVLMRFYTVPTAKEARRSVVWAIALIGAFYLSLSRWVTAPRRSSDPTDPPGVRPRDRRHADVARGP